MRSRLAQGWGFDLMIGVSVFLIGLTVFYFFALNYPTEGSDKLEELQYQGNVIADFLLSEGFPRDWNETNVIQIGILSDNKVNFTKLGRLYNLTFNETDGELDRLGYDRTKGIFNTNLEYYFNFSIDMSQIADPAPNYIGWNFNDEEGVSPENLIKVTRFTIYDNKPASLNIIVWET